MGDVLGRGTEGEREGVAAVGVGKQRGAGGVSGRFGIFKERGTEHGGVRESCEPLERHRREEEPVWERHTGWVGKESRWSGRESVGRGGRRAGPGGEGRKESRWSGRESGRRSGDRDRWSREGERRAGTGWGGKESRWSREGEPGPGGEGRRAGGVGKESRTGWGGKESRWSWEGEPVTGTGKEGGGDRDRVGREGEGEPGPGGEGRRATGTVRWLMRVVSFYGRYAR